jgi:hypothetical protein
MTSFANRPNLPRGLRDNNPGNIRPNPTYIWSGQTSSENNYCTFDSVENGIRAMAKDLKTKIVKHGWNTIAKYIPAYAPEEDNNNTAGYIARVSKLSGFAPDAPLTANYDTLFRLVKAHINVEVGDHYAGMITDDMIKAGVRMAIPGSG